MTGPTPAISPEMQAIDAQASVLMKRGLHLLTDRHADAVSEALACFDRALELRSRLPIDGVARFRYGLAACWLNRADALIRLGDPAQIPIALGAYDQGISLCRGLPLQDDPRFPRRLAIACQNRGLALQAQGRSAVESIAAFTDAITVLEHEHSVLIPDRQYLLAAVCVNLARAWASGATAETDSLAREAALRAIALVEDLEADDADAAEVGLSARHVICHTVADRLSTAAGSDETIPDDVHDATDRADDGLRLVRHWEQRGVTRFRSLAYDLFRFGARVYGKFQPHFLDEFVLENTDPAQSSSEYVDSAAMRWATWEARRLPRGPALADDAHRPNFRPFVN